MERLRNTLSGKYCLLFIKSYHNKNEVKKFTVPKEIPTLYYSEDLYLQTVSLKPIDIPGPLVVWIINFHIEYVYQ